ncbi:MAG: hypothetical protein NC191_06155 [Muribaculaceae bacterium]|nr:hypothetical protein [Muribaculaceae bacterium]
MNGKFIQKTNVDERPSMIVLGVLAFYFLVESFFVYLFLLHRISLSVLIITVLIFTVIYFPRLMIIYKIKMADSVKVSDDFVMINGEGILFSDITDYTVEPEKPQVVFYLNGKAVLFQQAKFHLKLPASSVSFTVTGSEKIKLLNEFFNKTITP